MVRLKLGGRYRRRDGAVVEIVDDKAGVSKSTQRYKCSEGKRYSANGCWKKDGSTNEWDLIVDLDAAQPSRAQAPAPVRAQAAPAPQPRAGYQDRYGSPQAAPAQASYAQAAPAVSTLTSKKDGNKLTGLFGKLFGGSIGQVTDSSFKMSLRGAAVRANDGQYVSYDTAAKQMVDVTELLLPDAEQFLYKLPSTAIKAGDCVVISESPLEVIYAEKVDATTGEVVGLNPRTNKREVWQPRTNIFNVKFFITLTSLFNFGDIAGGTGGIQSILPLLMLSGGDTDTESLLPLLLMQGGLGGAGNSQNQLLPLLLMGGLGGKKGGKSGGMMEMLMMSQMFGGAAGGSNPFGAIFGGVQAAPAATAAAAEPTA